MFKYIYRYTSYKELCGYIQRNEVYASKICDDFEKLREICIGLCDHYPPELVDEATVLFLRMFTEQDKVTQKHMLNMRSMFGCVTEATANKIFVVSLFSFQ